MLKYITPFADPLKIHNIWS